MLWDGVAGAAIDLEALKIIPGKRCWVLTVSGLVLAADGSLIDALSIAAKVTYPPHALNVPCTSYCRDANMKNAGIMNSRLEISVPPRFMIDARQRIDAKSVGECFAVAICRQL